MLCCPTGDHYLRSRLELGSGLDMELCGFKYPTKSHLEAASNLVWRQFDIPAPQSCESEGFGTPQWSQVVFLSVEALQHFMLFFWRQCDMVAFGFNDVFQTLFSNVESPVLATATYAYTVCQSLAFIRDREVHTEWLPYSVKACTVVAAVHEIESASILIDSNQQ